MLGLAQAIKTAEVARPNLPECSRRQALGAKDCRKTAVEGQGAASLKGRGGK